MKVDPQSVGLAGKQKGAGNIRPTKRVKVTRRAAWQDQTIGTGTSGEAKRASKQVGRREVERTPRDLFFNKILPIEEKDLGFLFGLHGGEGFFLLLAGLGNLFAQGTGGFAAEGLFYGFDNRGVLRIVLQHLRPGYGLQYRPMTAGHGKHRQPQKEEARSASKFVVTKNQGDNSCLSGNQSQGRLAPGVVPQFFT
jgi:hypothetical protein